MTRKIKSDVSDDLRSRAEENLRGKAAPSLEQMGDLSPEETLRLLHELNVHQLELEMQNNELLRTQQALDAERARYFDLYDVAPVGYVTLNEEGVILQTNLTAARMLDLTRGDLLGKRLDSFISPQDQDIYYFHRKKTAKVERVQACELRLLKSDRTEFWARIETLVVQARGDTIEHRVVINDISGTKAAAAALQESEDKYKVLIDNLNEGVWVIDEKGITTFVNPKMTEILGYSSHEMLGKHLFSFMSDEAKELAQENIGRRQQGIKENHRFEFTRKDGTLICTSLETAPLYDKKGTYTGAIAGIIDITDRKKAQEELQNSNELMARFIQHSPIYAFIKSVTPTESRLIQASENYIEMIGISRDQMIGKTMNELFPAAFAAKMTADDWNVVCKGNTIMLDEEFRGRSYITIKFPIALSGKNLLAGYTIDITDRKKAEKENNDLQAQLLYSEKLAALGTLSAGVGHEILNPLAIIKGFSNRLAKKLRIADPKEDVDKIWNAIARSVVRIENIINGLTIHARVDNDTIEAVDVNETINEVLSFILSLKHGDLIEIHQNLTAVNSIARGNKGKFHQVMFNIIKNAFDALEVRPSGRQIIIETLSAGENVIIHVSDNGSGIPRDAISRIFEPFFTTKVVGKGTGLGLSISKTIIEKFGGTITVSSDVGVGTKFTITLPRMNTQTEQIHPFIVDKLFNETN